MLFIPCALPAPLSPDTHARSLMKYLLLALAITAVSAQFEDEAAMYDLIEEDMALPCIPKPCVLPSHAMQS